MTKRFLLALSALLMTLAVCGAALAEDKPIVNGIDPDFPPYAFVDKAGQPSGFDVESLNWIAKEMGFTVEHRPTDWDGIIPSLQTKKIDVIASGMTINEERRKAVDFTIPYQKISQVLIVKDGSKLTVETATAKGKKIGAQRGTSEAKWIKDNMVDKGKKFQFVLYDSDALAIEDILNGRVDAAAMNEGPAKVAIKAGKAIKILGTYGQPDEEYGYAVRKDDKELLTKLNDGLKKLMASPTWQELKTKYEIQ